MDKSLSRILDIDPNGFIRFDDFLSDFLAFSENYDEGARRAQIQLSDRIDIDLLRRIHIDNLSGERFDQMVFDPDSAGGDSQILSPTFEFLRGEMKLAVPSRNQMRILTMASKDYKVTRREDDFNTTLQSVL